MFVGEVKTFVPVAEEDAIANEKDKKVLIAFFSKKSPDLLTIAKQFDIIAR